MQRDRRNVSPSFDRRMLHFGSKLIIFTIACGLVLGQSDTQQDSNSDRIFFPGPSGRSSASGSEEPVKTADLDDRKLSASLKIAQRINSMQSYEEFLKFIGAPEEPSVLIAGRFGGEKERSNAERLRQAKCMPDLTPVSLKMDNNPAKSIYPSCVRVMRCGGCCAHALFSCQPIATEIRNIEVVVYEELGSELMPVYKGKEIVAVEEHTKCKCDCKIKAEHCNEKQDYKKDICQCVCTNKDEEQKCRLNNNTKLWDVDRCTCQCREFQDCSTGYYFDQNTCRCEKKT